MDCASSEHPPPAGGYVPAGAEAVKIVVVGPFAVGKTTLVGAVSDIAPLRTEERMTSAGAMVDVLERLGEKDTTTVAMDFGRTALAEDIVLYIFGAPGQPRFAHMVRTLLEGALGGIVMLDERRVHESFDAIDLMETAGLPYTVAVNHFPDTPAHREAELRDALSLTPTTPLVRVDARERTSATRALIALVTHLLSRTPEPTP
ncbi:ATP/GTP-binding protein [Streptomyces alkaliphilus]|uniref:ATP/GTP-binding protein n=1 Tax=Streptomyces alkaliphilus TaxID=1472722 RepID=A0A7W3Y308_9ACTN|nr:ATP/GTP-binding protein [Streptomyces alkaliphilus]MBB0246118.1 ATP/GTP-binding protein [Streptomyces alkaliphilus]